MLLDYHSAYYAQSQVDLVAHVAAEAQVAAAVTVERRLSAQITGAASVLATVTVTRPIAAAVAAEASASAALFVTRPLAAAIAAQAGVSVVLTVTEPTTVALTGAVAARAGVSAALTVTRSLTAHVAATAGVSAVLRTGSFSPVGGALTLAVAADTTALAVAADAATLTVAAESTTVSLAADAATVSVAADVTTLEVELTYAKVEGDTLPLLVATLKRNGVASPIAGGTAVLRWSIGGASGTITGTVTDGPGGVCEFDGTALPAGRGQCEVFATYADAETRTFPSADAMPLVVRAHL